jgi:hypothetical protein
MYSHIFTFSPCMAIYQGQNDETPYKLLEYPTTSGKTLQQMHLKAITKIPDAYHNTYDL